ncbi:MAG: hotdog fold thioesterase [Methanomicrobiaceae archaeon]|nr:hotdog fold thioesterase [Methanomicrobiaceae archaeon]
MEHGREDGRERISAIESCEYARLNGLWTVALGEEVRVAMDARGKENGFGVIHGGAIFTLADQAFGLAANLRGEGQVAISACIRYLSPATGRLEAVARLVDENEETSIYEVQVLARDRVAAVFMGTGYKIRGDR